MIIQLAMVQSKLLGPTVIYKLMMKHINYSIRNHKCVKCKIKFVKSKKKKK